jgi:hypothetical protein
MTTLKVKVSSSKSPVNVIRAKDLGAVQKMIQKMTREERVESIRLSEERRVNSFFHHMTYNSGLFT